MSKCAEVVIIGGGIIGCTAAYYLAKDGVSLIVLEKTVSNDYFHGWRLSDL